ncbi:MAG TPA: hypothetical protein VJN02_12740 [Gammaproteobacteria bacterium]|nr:hypothetical protein [Gammaproteobacteria bacterium]
MYTVSINTDKQNVIVSAISKGTLFTAKLTEKEPLKVWLKVYNGIVDLEHYYEYRNHEIIYNYTYLGILTVTKS